MSITGRARTTAPTIGRRQGLILGAAAVAAVTAVIELLQHFVPVLSLGVLYMFAVLPVAVFSGTAAAVLIAVASMLAFNFFFLPPLYTFTLADPSNWFSLGVFVVTAVLVSELASRSRRRATESDLLADIATSLLERGPVAEELDRIADRIGQAVQARAAHIDLGTEVAPGPGEQVVPLEVGGRVIGRLRLDRPSPQAVRGGRRIIGGLASLVGVAIDRDRLQQEALEAEALRRSDAMKTALLRAVSHDLRSPMMAILTSASALDRADFDLGDDDRRDLLHTIRTEGERLDRIVSNLLDLSRLQASAATPDMSLWSVDDLVVQAISDLPDSSRVRSVLGDASAVVRVDGHQVERVLVNLLENALKYSPGDEPVQVQVGGTHHEVHIRVIDHGPGISGEDARLIFEPFQRGGATGGIRGAGLGLAIAKGFAEANGGRLWVESRSGQGATFVLALPVAAGVGAAV
ncbi:MAG TPA: ATP-binding protein [Gaiellales bacterium]|nr:ATP-binding protein [Gaiellales bacterium]